MAQEAEATITVRVLRGADPVEGAEVRSATRAASSGPGGNASLRLSAGDREITVRKPGYARETLRLSVRAGRDSTVAVQLREEAIETEGIVVTSTRTGQRIEDEPVRVEVLSREEVEEKLLMTPGDVAMLLNETSGLRVQVTSPSLGGANVRVQGLRGRYTQVLSDGLPLYGGQTGALGLLQIPPMDLAQVEVIKGAASALYGASALGGVINLISRQPGDASELLVNRTSHGGTDAVLWASGGLGERWGYTLLGSGHRHGREDFDADGWADVPGYRRGVVRPRLFWNDGKGRSVFLTVGATAEARKGGTLQGATLPDGSVFAEELSTRRLDAGLVGRFLIGESRLFNLRASAMGQGHAHGFGEVRERDAHRTWFGEASLSGTDRGHTWVVGAALQGETYHGRDFSRLDYAYTIPSVFVQNEYSPADWVAISASGRVDHHSEYGTSLNPRLSALVRPGESWTARLSAGTGYFAPTPFIEKTEAIGLSRLLPLQGLHAERARSASLDVGRTVGPFELNGTLFASVIEGAVSLRQSAASPGRVELFNVDGLTRTYGTELLTRFRYDALHLTATHTYVRSTEPFPGASGRREVPLTPRHTGGLVGMWEAEDRGRIGMELYYTGRQSLEDNPYRTVSEPHVVLGFLVERRVGRARLFLNAENLTDVRQTRYERLVLPARGPEGRWTTDAWAPLEGRALNAGVRMEF